MKKFFLALVTMLILLFLTIQAQGQDRDWGIGLRLGDPTGVTAKKYFPSNKALELALGADHNGDGITFLVHYLIHHPISDAPGLDWYVGFGGQIEDNDRKDRDDDDDVELGADGVIGLEYTFAQSRLSAFLDVILFLELIDDPLDLELDAGIGLRYNF